MTPPRTMVIGIGSRHGDDQAGLLVADALAERLAATPAITIRKAATPADLLAFLETVDRLVVCDAVKSGERVGRLVRLEWPDARIARVRSLGSHDLSLAEALELADQLGLLPPSVVVWGIEAAGAIPNSPPCAEVLAAVGAVGGEIERELSAQSASNDFSARTNPS